MAVILDALHAILGCVSGPVQACCQGAYTNITSCEANIEKLKEAMAELKAKRDDVKNTIERGEKEGKKPTSQVRWWLDVVTNLENVETSISNEAQKRGTNHMLSWLLWMPLAYELSKKAIETTEKARKHFEKWNNSDVLFDLYDQVSGHSSARDLPIPSTPVISHHPGLDNGQNSVYAKVDTSGRNCLMLFARALAIEHSDKPRFWTWITETDMSGTVFEVACLKEVWYLHIRGAIDVSELTPGVEYDVFFELKLRSTAQGFDSPVKLELNLPDNSNQESTERLNQRPREEWVDVKVGRLSGGETGVAQVYLTELNTDFAKTGLLVKGIVVLPST